MAESFTLYKLIILYMLNKVDFPLTTSQISEFVLDKGYTSYFKLQEALSDLTQSDLIRPETTHNRTLYHLTENGSSLIDLKLTVPTEKEAEAIVSHWNTKSQEIYTLLLSNLL